MNEEVSNKMIKLSCGCGIDRDMFIPGGSYFLRRLFPLYPWLPPSFHCWECGMAVKVEVEETSEHPIDYIVPTEGEAVVYTSEYCPYCKKSHWLTIDERLLVDEWREKCLADLFFVPDLTNPYHKTKVKDDKTDPPTD